MLQLNLFITFIVGVLNSYCEVTVGSLTLKTPFIKPTNNPKWNTAIQFLLYDLVEDIIHINIFNNEFAFIQWFVLYLSIFIQKTYSSI